MLLHSGERAYTLQAYLYNDPHGCTVCLYAPSSLENPGMYLIQRTGKTNPVRFGEHSHPHDDVEDLTREATVESQCSTNLRNRTTYVSFIFGYI